MRHDGRVTHYDLAVIGTGSGNTVVTHQFKDWGRSRSSRRTVFGGTCLNVGCIPTKMFVYPADLARNAEHAPELGVDTSYDGARWPEIRDRIFGRIDPIVRDGEAYRRRLPNIDVYDEHCTFVDDHTLDTGIAGARSPPTRSSSPPAAGSTSRTSPGSTRSTSTPATP